MRRLKDLQAMSNQQVMYDATNDHYIALTLPENPVNYTPIINNKDGGLAGDLTPAQMEESKVLVIGAGSAGLCAAYELLKKGLEPIVYEPQEWIGGRMYTYDMPETSTPGGTKYVELGAMRIPQTQTSLFNYLYNFGVMKRQLPESPDPSTTPFSNEIIKQWPLFPSPKAVSTRIQFEGKVAYYDAATRKYSGDKDLISQITVITNKFDAMVNTELAGMYSMDDQFHKDHPDPTPAEYAEYYEKRLAQWNSTIVSAYQDKSLFEVLNGSTGAAAWTSEQIQLLATVGIGTGGIGSMYTTVYLETLREAYHIDDTNQRLIQGGLRQLADAFAMDVPSTTYGGSGGSGFNDSHDGQVVINITLRSGAVMDAIQLGYADSSFGPQHGGTGGDSKTLDLRNNPLTSIQIQYNSKNHDTSWGWFSGVSHIKFTTLGNKTLEGGISATSGVEVHTFDLTNTPLLGITGSVITGGMNPTLTLINSFGVITKKNLAAINGWETGGTPEFPKIVSHPRIKVTKIRTNPTDPSQPVEVWHEKWIDNEWQPQPSEMYTGVILTASLRAIEMYIDINPEAFSNEVWYGIREFGMVDSNKIFFYCKTRWWEQWNIDHSEPTEKIVTTLTDRTLAQTYFMDLYGTDPTYAGEGGVILVNYNWNKDASKFGALTLPQKIELCAREFKAVFPEGAYEVFTSSLLDGWEEGAGVKSINWNNTPYMNGAFRMADPGQYNQHMSMYNQGIGDGTVNNNGLYLAGESLAWFGLSGWIEGALFSGINAAQAVINRIIKG